MKWTKSIIGEIGFIDTKNKLFYTDAIKKIPENARIMKSWEFLKLIDEDFKSLKNIPKDKFYFCYATKMYFRVCRLYDFGDYSGFNANSRNVDSAFCLLRRLLVVRRWKCRKRLYLFL